MDANPAGWYDDPDEPGRQRWWDGSSWTEQRADAAPSGAPTAPPPMTPPPPAGGTPPPPADGPGSFAPPPGSTSGGSSRKGLWIALAVGGVVVVLVIVAIVAIALLGSSKDVTKTVEENLPSELENNFQSQGLTVTVSQVDCDKIADDDGPFSTTCRISIDGLAPTVEADVDGTVEGNTVTLTDARSDTTILDEALAVKAAQPVVDEVASDVTVLSCTLDAPVVVVDEGLTFDCTTDSDETATFEVQGGQLAITNVK